MDTISHRDIVSMDKTFSLMVSRLLVTALTILTIFGIKTFAKTCDPTGALVVCQPASRAIFIAGIIACGIALALDLAGNPLIRCLLDMLIALCGLFIAIAPGRLFPFCADSTSLCNTKTHPFALAIGIALFVMANVDCVLSFRYAVRIAKLVLAVTEQQQSSSPSSSSQPSFGTRQQGNTNTAFSGNSNKAKYKG